MDDSKAAIGMLQSVLARLGTVSYTHLRAHETVLDLVCRLLLEKKKKNKNNSKATKNIINTYKNNLHMYHYHHYITCPSLT